MSFSIAKDRTRVVTGTLMTLTGETVGLKVFRDIPPEPGVGEGGWKDERYKIDIKSEDSALPWCHGGNSLR